jgi:predicted nucleic acid-binding protein
VILVLDASAAVKLVVEEPGSAEVRDLLRDRGGHADLVLAPELVLAEVGNVVWRLARTGVLTREDAQAALSAVPAIFARLHPVGPLAEEALRLATDGDHPIYDCFYLALARREAATLVTADSRFFRRFAAGAGEPAIRLIAPQPSSSA